MATTRVERRTFYEMQRRHRRSGWRFTALSALAVLCLGVPLSVVVSPFLVATGLIANDLANLVTPTPDLVGGMGDWFDEGTVDDPATPEDEGSLTLDLAPADVAWITVGLIVPGMVGMLALWLAVRRLFLRVGAGAVEVAAGARPPRPGDLEERQLVNLVEEMALAAGVPPPRVRVVDSPDANAAVAGSSVHDATLVVPRGLLAELGRGPTGGVVADMLAVVVNGDLRAALTIASLFQTFDVVAALLAAPLSRRTRRALWRLVRLSLRRRPGEAGVAEIRFVAEELTYVGQLGGLDDQPSGALTTMATLPFMVANVAFTLVRLIFGGLVVAPIMAALWRRRRLLADATAVELTRDPDSIARALDHLRRRGAVPPPGPWTHLCAVGPEVGRERTMDQFARKRDEIWTSERRPGESRPASALRRMREATAASSEVQREMRADDASLDEKERMVQDAGQELAEFLPPLGKRLDRLEEMGAHLPDDPDAAWTPTRPSLWYGVLGWVIAIPLVAIIAVLMLGVFGCLLAFLYLALLFEAMLLAPLVLVVHALVR